MAIFEKIPVTHMIFLVILVAGFLLRVLTLDPLQIWIDEGFTIMQQRAIVTHGYPLLLSGLVEWKDILMPYILASLRMLSGTEQLLVFKMVSVFFGTMSIVVMFMIVKELLTKKAALFATFLIAFSYWHIAWSQQIRSYTMIIFFLLVAILFSVYYEKWKHFKYLIYVWISIIFAILAKTSLGLLLVPAFLFYLLLKKRYVFCLIICTPMLIAGFFFTPLFLDALSHGIVNYAPQYILGYFWGYFGIIFLLSLTGAILAFQRDQKMRDIHLMLLMIVFTVLIFFSFFSYIRQFRYLFYLTPIIFIYTTYFIFYITEYLSRKKFCRTHVAVAMIGFIIIVDLVSVQSLNFFPKEKYILEERTPQPEFHLAYEYLRNNIAENDLIASPYPYMDLIYLDRFNYVVPISYTGDPNDTSIHYGREFYTGAIEFPIPAQAAVVRKNNNIYFIFDNMGYERISNDLRKYIDANSTIVFRKNTTEGDFIVVRKMTQDIL